MKEKKEYKDRNGDYEILPNAQHLIIGISERMSSIGKLVALVAAFRDFEDAPALQYYQD